jgi:multiple sugar transport system permease protein
VSQVPPATATTEPATRPGGLPGVTPVRPRPSLRTRWFNRDTLAGYAFLFPALAHFAVFFAGLLVVSLGLSFVEWDLFNPPSFVGIENYRQLLFEDPNFWPVFLRTGYYVLLVIPTGMAASLLLALAVNTKLRGIKFFRATYVIPVVASAVAVALVWKWVLATNNGLLNWFLSLFGIGPLDWLGRRNLAMPSVALVQVWRGLGEGMIIFLAGLQTIPQHLYEAAELDGAGRWRKFWHVTWPLLSPTTFFVAVLEVIGSFQVFDMIYLMTKGGPGESTNVYIYYLYQQGFRDFEMGYAAAMAWLLFAVIGILTLVQFRLLNKRVHYELG